MVVVPLDASPVVVVVVVGTLVAVVGEAAGRVTVVPLLAVEAVVEAGREADSQAPAKSDAASSRRA